MLNVDVDAAALVIEGLRFEDGDPGESISLRCPAGMAGIFAREPRRGSRFLRRLVTGQALHVERIEVGEHHLNFSEKAAERGRWMMHLPRDWCLPSHGSGELFLREVARMRREPFDEEAVAAFVELAELTAFWPHPPEHWVEDRFELLAFAAVACSRAELLLLDRPLEGQPAHLARRLLAWAAALRPGRVCLCHSVRLDLLEGLCPWLLLHDGRRWRFGEAETLARALGLGAARELHRFLEVGEEAS